MADAAKKNKGLSRSAELLESMNLPKNFKDPKLPKGVFSHSQYYSFKLCGRAYEFKYVLGIQTPSYASTSRGSAVHKGCEMALTAKMKTGTPLGLEEVKTFVEAEFDQQAQNVLDWGEDKPERVKKEALDLYEAFHIHGLPHINPVGIEKGFAVKFGDVPILGWIDLIDEQPAMDVTKLDPEAAAIAPKKRITVDFKTSAKKWSESALRDNTQLTLYSEVEGTPHVRIDQLIPYKKGAGYVRSESERTPQDVAVLKEDLNEVADFVRKGIFPMTDIGSWQCNASHCSFHALCRGRKR